MLTFLYQFTVNLLPLEQFTKRKKKKVIFYLISNTNPGHFQYTLKCHLLYKMQYSHSRGIRDAMRSVGGEQVKRNHSAKYLHLEIGANAHHSP